MRGYSWYVNDELVSTEVKRPPVKDGDKIQLVVSMGKVKFVTNVHIYSEKK